MLLEIDGLKLERLDPEGSPRPHPILFVHGMWGGSWYWRDYLSFFSSRGYACFAINLRGHHGSRPVPDIGKTSLHDYVEDVQDAARALGRPILIGHSMGGVLVLKAAELLSPPAVVSITPASPRALPSLSLLKAALRHIPNIVLRRPIVPSKAEAVRLALNRLPAAEQDRVYERQVPESGRVALELGVLGLPVKPDGLACPRLMIAAGEDRLTPAASVRRLAARSRAEVREYPGFGHMIVLEPGWEWVAEDIAGWLQGALAGPGPPGP